MHTGFVERRAIMRHVFISVLERPFQTPELQRSDLVARGDLDRVERAALRRQIGGGRLGRVSRQIFRCAAFQCFSRLAISAGLKWQ